MRILSTASISKSTKIPSLPSCYKRRLGKMWVPWLTSFNYFTFLELKILDSLCLFIDAIEPTTLSPLEPTEQQYLEKKKKKKKAKQQYWCYWTTFLIARELSSIKVGISTGLAGGVGSGGCLTVEE